MGIAEVIRLRRIEKAKSPLLQSPEFNLSEVASLCGFHDYNYFITVFKKITGTSPKQFGRGNLPPARCGPTGNPASSSANSQNLPPFR